MKKVIAYIDGFNLYFGLKGEGWRRFYWLNIQQLINLLLKKDQQLVKIKYFTAKVRPETSAKRQRQKAYINALRTLPDFEIIYGRYKQYPKICSNCSFKEDVWVEKMTDVKISVEMISDAHRDEFDVALLVSGDSDLTPIVRSVKQMFPNKRIVVAFPPGRYSEELASIADAYFHIGRKNLSASVFPTNVKRKDGTLITRPSSWR